MWSIDWRNLYYTPLGALFEHHLSGFHNSLTAWTKSATAAPATTH